MGDRTDDSVPRSLLCEHHFAGRSVCRAPRTQPRCETPYVELCRSESGKRFLEPWRHLTVLTSHPVPSSPGRKRSPGPTRDSNRRFDTEDSSVRDRPRPRQQVTEPSYVVLLKLEDDSYRNSISCTSHSRGLQSRSASETQTTTTYRK